MAKLTGGQAIVRTLTNHGVDTIFGLPGVQLDNTFDALYEARNTIRTIHTRHPRRARPESSAFHPQVHRSTRGPCGVSPHSTNRSSRPRTRKSTAYRAGSTRVGGTNGSRSASTPLHDRKAA